MNTDQKTVAAGALSGVAAMLLSTWLLYTVLPAPASVRDQSDAVLYALRWLPLAALPLLAMIASVGNARAIGPAIDPTLGNEDQAMRINIRAANNTLEEIRESLGVDSLGYLSLDGMLESVPGGPHGFCHACFSGDYPTPPPTDPDKLRFGCGC